MLCLLLLFFDISNSLFLFYAVYKFFTESLFFLTCCLFSYSPHQPGKNVFKFFLFFPLFFIYCWNIFIFRYFRIFFFLLFFPQRKDGNEAALWIEKVVAIIDYNKGIYFYHAQITISTDIIMMHMRYRKEVYLSLKLSSFFY